MHCFKAALYSTRSQHLRGRYGARPTFQRNRTEIAIIEIPSRELARVRANQYGPGLCQSLQACRKVGRFTDGGLFCRDLTNQQLAHNDGARRNANPNLQSIADIGPELCYCIDDFQCGAHRLDGTILLCDRIAEIGQHPIAHILRNHALVASYDCTNSGLIRRHHPPHVFRIQTRRQCSRTNEITEHKRQIASLSFTG